MAEDIDRDKYHMGFHGYLFLFLHEEKVVKGSKEVVVSGNLI